MATVLPTPDRFAGLRGFSENLVSGLLQQAQQRKQLADQQLLVQQIQRAQAGGTPAFTGFQTPQGAAAAAQFAAQQPTQLQQDLVRSQIQQNLGAAFKATQPDSDFKVIDKFVDDPTSPTGFSVEQFNQAGQPIGRRFASRKEVLQGVPEGALQRPTETKLEKEIIDLEGTLGELSEIEASFNPDFFVKLNLRDPLGDSKTSAVFTAAAEKFGLQPGAARIKFLKDRTKFFADSKRVFLKFRKFITGVAGGIQEFREIAKATIDPEKDSPSQFRAKMKSMRDNAVRLNNLMRSIRQKGLEPTKSNIKAELENIGGLKNVPIDDPQAEERSEALRGVGIEAGLPGFGQQQPPAGVISTPGVRTPRQEARMQELLRKAGR